MNRRALLTRLVATGVLGLGVGEGQAHTPYSQWKVYRQRHLLIGASREDAPTYPLAKSITAVLNENLPAASARVTRARTRYRLGSLFSTDQLQFILVSASDVTDIAHGRGDFTEFGPVELGIVYQFGVHVLIARIDVPDHHAWLVTRTLMDSGSSIPGATTPGKATLALHPGTRAAIRLEPRPEPSQSD